MTIKVAINGYGRIGRNILRALYESQRNNDIKIIAINDIGDIKTNVHLTRFDSTHGRFNGDIDLQGNHMVVNGDKIQLTAERNPAQLPWAKLGVDVVYECSGLFTNRESAAMHLQAGAKKVIISAPGKGVDKTIVYGVNHQQLSAQDTIISNASCTTNCLATMIKPLNEKLGIVSGLMNTVHAYTNDQALIDSVHSDLRRHTGPCHSSLLTLQIHEHHNRYNCHHIHFC